MNVATKSFTTDFKFTAKNGSRLLSTLENTNVVDVDRINESTQRQRVSDVKSSEHIQSIMSSFLGEKGRI